MSRPVTIITDSASDVPQDLVDELGIRIVPLLLHFGTETYRDNIDITKREFYRRLREEPELPTTSQVPPAEFTTLYQDLIDAGHDVLAILLSRKVSGTLEAAQVTAEQWGPARIRVVDSSQISMACGWLAVVAARAAREGASLDDLEALARDMVPRARLYAIFDTLEYVYRGGRLGKGSVLMSSLFKIKPMITLEDGEVAPVAKPRTLNKAMRKTVELMEECAPLEELAVIHADAPDRAARLVELLEHLQPRQDIVISEVGPVLGTHTGPGVVGVCFVRG